MREAYIAHLGEIVDASSAVQQQKRHKKAKGRGLAAKSEKTKRRARANNVTEDESEDDSKGPPLDMDTYRKILRDVLSQYPHRDPDEVNAETDDCLTTFTQIIDQEQLANYLESQEHMLSTDDLEAREAMRQRLTTEFSVNNLMNSHEVELEPPIEDICSQIGFDWPELKPHGHKSKVLFKQHQIDGM